MCDCHSYNWDDPNTGTPEVELPAPSWSSKKTICVDECIAGAIKMLWANGIVTRGCCCGHNRLHPSVVLECGQDAKRALELLTQYDDRHWEVMKWKLMKISKTSDNWEIVR